MFILTGASRKTSGGRALRCVGAPRPPAARLQAPVGDISKWHAVRHFYLG